MPDFSQSKPLTPDSMPAVPVKDSQDKYLLITPAVKIPLHDIQFEYSHASGPGGQHVNTTDSAVLLRFNIRTCSEFSAEIRRKLYSIARRKINLNGELLITASEFRSQKQNKKKALLSLKEIVQQATRETKPRKKTDVPAASKSQRLQAKKNRAEKRKQRKTPSMEE